MTDDQLVLSGSQTPVIRAGLVNLVFIQLAVAMAIAHAALESASLPVEAVVQIILILLFGRYYDSFVSRIVILENEMVLSTPFRTVRIPYNHIQRVIVYRRSFWAMLVIRVEFREHRHRHFRIASTPSTVAAVRAWEAWLGRQLSARGVEASPLS